MRPGAKQRFHCVPDHRDPRRAANQHDFIDLLDGDAGVSDTGPAGTQRAVDDIGDQLFEQFPGNFALVVPALILELDGRREHERKLLLGLDYSAAQCLYSFAVGGEVAPPLGLNVLEADADEPVVDIVAAQVRVAVSRQDFENPFVQLENGDVERAAAQVIDGYDPLFAFVETVRQSGGGRLVHQPQHVEAGDAARVLGGLPLRVIEVGRHGDDRLRDRLSQMRFGVLLELS